MYAALAALSFITFRCAHAVEVSTLPLLVTSFLFEALIVGLGTSMGVPLNKDYRLALQFSGKVAVQA